MALLWDAHKAELNGKAVRAIQRGTKSTAPELKYVPDTVASTSASVDRSQFAVREQFLSRDLVTIARLSNQMDSDPDMDTWGWFNGNWWRTTTLFPYNARTMESVLTLAWFYTHDRVWNPYFKDPAVAIRLLASLRYYISLQKPNGGFTTAMDDEDGNPATTGFGLSHLALSYIYLDQVPLEVATWEDVWKPRMLQAMIKAAQWILDPTNTDSWEHGGQYSNQLIGGIGGVARVLDLMPQSVQTQFANALGMLEPTIFGDGGWMYENYGPDFPYTSGTAMPYLAYLYDVTKDDRMAAIARRAYDFFSYNSLVEPNQLGFILNDAIHSRTPMTALPWARNDEAGGSDGASAIRVAAPVLNAFLTSAEDKAAYRAAWAAGSGPVTSPPKGSLSPHRMHRANDTENLPTLAQKNAAIAQFPYMASNSFTEHRTNGGSNGPQYNFHYLYVRRPNYYMGAAWGQRGQRSLVCGTFFYHPTTGTFIAAQGGSKTFWGLEQGTYRDAFTSSLNTSSTIPNNSSNFTLDLSVLTNESSRSIAYNTNSVSLTVQRAGNFFERLPLVLWPENTTTSQAADVVSFTLAGGGSQQLTDDNPLTVNATAITVTRPGRGTFTVTLDQAHSVTLQAVHEETAAVFSAADRTVRHLDIDATDSITYTVQITPQ